MKTKLFFVALVALVVNFSSCKKVDVIHGVKPVDTTFVFHFPLSEFHQLGIAGDTVAQKGMIEKYKPQLTKNVLSHYPCIKDEKNIRFILGSGFAEDVLSGDGKTYSGDFKNEVIIVLNDPCVKDTIFLACGNGMLLKLRLIYSSELGTGTQFRFVVQPGQSLAYFLPKLEAWGVSAEELGLPIVDAKGKHVSKERYMNELGKWWSGHLFAGDVIDLYNKTITHNGKVVDFKLRQEETKEANKILRDKMIERMIKADIKKQQSKKKHRK